DKHVIHQLDVDTAHMSKAGVETCQQNFIVHGQANCCANYADDSQHVDIGIIHGQDRAEKDVVQHMHIDLSGYVEQQAGTNSKGD
ncbi:hypothetical protein ADUPG1_005732, partial [Aduncisulcus paluster]